MNNTFRLFAIVFVIGLFCTIDLRAQGSQKYGSPVKGVGVVIKHGGASRATICWSSDDSTVASYRLKVWQLMQGQNGAQIMRTDPPIVSKEVKNVTPPPALPNNKNPELMRTATADLDTIKACTESLDQTDTSAQRHAIRTKGAGGDEVRTTSTDLPPCPRGKVCEYQWTIEALGADGNPVDSNGAPLILRNFKGWDPGKKEEINP